MICRSDTVGVFQIESRAQMSMLPRLEPRNYYDLVIEVSIVRPGPITGGMVHPYLRRRSGEEPVVYPHPCLEPVLSKTLGVPLFQEQVMKLAVVAADYTPGEADQLRRDMAAWHRTGQIDRHRDRLVTRMMAKGIAREFAERVFDQIRGIRGLRLSREPCRELRAHRLRHRLAPLPLPGGVRLLAAQRAADGVLHAGHDRRRRRPARRRGTAGRRDRQCTGIARWSRSGHRRPAGGTCARSDEARVRTGRRYSDAVRRQSGNARSYAAKGWEASASDRTGTAHCRWNVPVRPAFAVRMGLRYVKSLSEERDWRRIEAARAERSFASMGDFTRRTHLDARIVRRLAEAGAFAWFEGKRRTALWEALDLGRMPASSLPLAPHEPRPDFEPLGAFETIANGTTSSARTAPAATRWLRCATRLTSRKLPDAHTVAGMPDGCRVRYAGIVICRQRPATASSVTFMTLEDETGFVNVVVWKRVFDEYAVLARTASFLGVTGKLQSESGVVHIIADALWTPTIPARPPTAGSRDFH